MERAAELLQTGKADDSAVEGIVRATAHPKWEVRKAAAYSLLFVKDDKFDPPIARLLNDENEYVRNQATQTMNLRTVRKRTDPLGEEHGEVVRSELEDLERRHGPSARRACERVALKTTELIVRELHHELVSVITPLDSQLTRLHGQAGDQRTQKTLAKARTHVSRIGTVIRSMLDYTAETALQLTTVRISALLTHAVEAVRATEEDDFVIALPDDEATELVADFNRLSQALVNILRNAVEACSDRKQNAEIAVHVSQDGHGTSIRITDNGPGFPSFDEPVRRYATSKPQGLGFGLAVAKKIVETEHDGHLALSNGSTGGAIVTVTIPRLQEGANAV